MSRSFLFLRGFVSAGGRSVFGAFFTGAIGLDILVGLCFACGGAAAFDAVVALLRVEELGVA